MEGAMSTAMRRACLGLVLLLAGAAAACLESAPGVEPPSDGQEGSMGELRQPLGGGGADALHGGGNAGNGGGNAANGGSVSGGPRVGGCGGPASDIGMGTGALDSTDAGTEAVGDADGGSDVADLH
jgi:hypothetical protein